LRPFRVMEAWSYRLVTQKCFVLFCFPHSPSQANCLITTGRDAEHRSRFCGFGIYLKCRRMLISGQNGLNWRIWNSKHPKNVIATLPSIKIPDRSSLWLENVLFLSCVCRPHKTYLMKFLMRSCCCCNNCINICTCRNWVAVSVPQIFNQLYRAFW
jgi:hypothetical protein